MENYGGEGALLCQLEVNTDKKQYGFTTFEDSQSYLDSLIGCFFGNKKS
jgi:hypothetical protein